MKCNSKKSKNFKKALNSYELLNCVVLSDLYVYIYIRRTFIFFILMVFYFRVFDVDIFKQKKMLETNLFFMQNSISSIHFSGKSLMPPPPKIILSPYTHVTTRCCNSYTVSTFNSIHLLLLQIMKCCKYLRLSNCLIVLKIYSRVF